MIPRAGFDDDSSKESQHNSHKETKINDRTITSRDSVNGRLMTFSFHVEQADEIKCYIIWNGQTSFDLYVIYFICYLQNVVFCYYIKCVFMEITYQRYICCIYYVVEQ